MIEYIFEKLDISPQEKFDLAGFVRREPGNSGFASTRLFISVTILRCDGLLSALVSMDTLYVSDKIKRLISDRLFSIYGVLANSIVFNSSHTHAAPGIFDKVFGSAQSDYEHFVGRRIKESFTKRKEFRGCALSVVQGVLPDNLAIDRRSKLRWPLSVIFKSKIAMLPNLNSKYRIPLFVISVDDLDDDKRSFLMISTSCHPTFVNSEVCSSDYPGEICEAVEKTTGKAAVFFQGFCGDVRPNSITQNIWSGPLRQRLKVLLFNRAFRSSKPDDLDNFVSQVSEAIRKLIASPKRHDVDYIITNAFPFHVESECGNKREKFDVSLVSFGTKFIIIGVPAEVNFPVYSWLQSKLDEYSIIPFGYTGGMIGYLPDAYQIENGGYEVSSYKNYGWPSPLSQSSVIDFKAALIRQCRVFMAGHK